MKYEYALETIVR